MPEYRAYLLDKSGHITHAAIILREENDEKAIAIAMQLLDGHDIDLWHEDRRVVTLRAEAVLSGSSAKRPEDGAGEVG